MSFTFNGNNLLINLNSGVTSFNTQNLYAAWKNWVISGDNSKYPVALKTIGGDPISTTKSVSPYYFISNNWRIRPQESNHSLLVEGNLFVEGGVGNPFVPTTGNYNVFINISTSSDSTITTVTNNITGNIPQMTRIEQKVDDLTAISL